MVWNRQNIILAATGGFTSWLLIADSFPTIRYVCYSFLLGCCFTLFAFGVLAFSSVRAVRADYLRTSRLSGSSLGFLSPDNWKRDFAQHEDAARYEPHSLYASSFVVSESIDDLLSHALTDFISTWYDKISPNTRFRNEIDRAIRGAIIQSKDHISKSDLVEIFVSRIIPLITLHLREFDVAERAVRGKNLSRMVTETEELDFAIASKYKDGHLHPAACGSLSEPNQLQQDHIRKIVTLALPLLFTAEQLQSQAVTILLREILTCSILLPLVNLLRDPDTWNRLIEAYGHTALQDRKTVRKLRAALDQHAPAPRVKSTLPFPQLTVQSSERDFERFVRAIRRCNNLSDVRKFRNYVSSQLKRESLVEGQDSVYLRRLETSKRVLDQKVARLSMLNTQKIDDQISNEAHTPNPPNANASSLVDIMHNASSLSHFMEYMDRMDKMSLVQFWVVVDGFRNPLEDDFGDESAKVKWTTADWNDIVLINETYLSKPELHVSAEARQAVADFINSGRKASLDQYRKARTAILTTQSAILEEMQTQYYPGFKSSDLYFKCLALDDAATSSRKSFETPRTQSSHMASRNAFNHDSTNQNGGWRTSDTLSDILVPNRSPEPDQFRPSLDSERQPLFDDDLDNNVLTLSTNSITDYPGVTDGDSSHQNQILENMEAALSDIIAAEPHQDHRPELFSDVVVKPPENTRPCSMGTDKVDKGKPNIASLGLVNPVGRIGVFTDNDLFPDEEKFLEDEYADPVNDCDDDNILKDIHPAAPGDLGLAEAIMVLNEDIEKLAAQESVVDALTKKAELTNNTAELRVLGKSKSSLQREIRRKEMQRQQYIIQEGDTNLYGRATVQIKSIIIGKEEDKREFASYLVEVQRKASDKQAVASWVVPRRYSEFHELHQQLRSQYPAVRNLEFPRRRVVMKLQKDFLQKRRVALEAYLQQLLELPEVCRSRELRSFLSQRTIVGHQESNQEGDGKDLVSRIYSSVADGMDDFLGNIAVLDQLSVAGQSLINHLSNNTSPSSLETVNLPTDEDSVSAAEAEAELNAFENRELEPFVKPICDIFLELFSLNRGNSWFRGRAVVVVLHQLLGGTVERKIRDMVNSLLSEASLLRFTSMIKDTFWPDGGPIHLAEKRTLSERMKSRAEASITLATLIPDMAASVVGRANAQEAARKTFAVLNNERLNTHLVHTVLDELVHVMFGNK